jgi:2-keto-4-pentenoate hydratase
VIALLVEGARQGKVDPAAIRPLGSPQDGLRVQLGVLDRWIAAGDRLGGWKAAFTSGPLRDMMGAGFRPFGYVLASRVFASGDSVALDRISACHVEPELCLVLGAPLGGDDVDADAARAAVRGVAPAFEVNEIRLPPGADHALLLADDISQWGIVVGEETEVRTGLPDTTVEVLQDGARVTAVTPGEALDDPFLSLARLCASLAPFGHALRPGDHVITGSFSRHRVERPGRWEARFAGVGDVSVTFT